MERIGNEVERGLARMGDGSALALAEITGSWPIVVGEQIARNAWPLRIGKDGTLHVATSSATWAFELDRMRDELAARLEEAIPEHAPPSLRFRPGPVPEPGASSDSRATPEPVEVTPEAGRKATTAASSIDDPELRELVARAARASLSRARSDRGFW